MKLSCFSGIYLSLYTSNSPGRFFIKKDNRSFISLFSHLSLQPVPPSEAGTDFTHWATCTDRSMACFGRFIFHFTPPAAVVNINRHHIPQPAAGSNWAPCTRPVTTRWAMEPTENLPFSGHLSCTLQQLMLMRTQPFEKKIQTQTVWLGVKCWSLMGLSWSSSVSVWLPKTVCVWGDEYSKNINYNWNEKHI